MFLVDPGNCLTFSLNAAPYRAGCLHTYFFAADQFIDRKLQMLPGNRLLIPWIIVDGATVHEPSLLIEKESFRSSFGSERISQNRIFINHIGPFIALFFRI